MNAIHILEPLASNAMAEKINELEHTIGTVLPSHFKDFNKITGKVYYWFHEENDWGLEGNNKYPTLVSENLNDFIEKLTPTPLPTKEEIKRAIASGKVTITPKYVELRNAMRAKEGLPPLTFEEWDRLLNDPNRDDI